MRRWRRWSAALPYTGTEGSASAISFPGSATGCLMSAVLRSQRPAHGGRDPGKVAVNQTEEKDLNLEIALFTLYLEIKSFGQNGEGILPVTGIYIALMALTIVGFCLKAYRNNRRGGDD